VEGLNVGERSTGPADVLSHGRRALHLLRTPLYANAFYLWVNAAGAAVAGFAFWALVARLYDADDVGLGSAALSIVVLLATFSHLGLGMGLIRFLPDSGKGGPRLANAVFTTSAVGAVVLSTVFLVGVPLWAPSLDFLREQPLFALAFISFVVAATFHIVQTHAFLAIRKAKYILVQVIFLQATRLALPLMVISFGAFGIVVSGGMGAVLGAAAGFILLTRGFAGYRPAGVIDPASVTRVFPFSVANYVADSLLLTPGLILPLIVVVLLGSTQGAYFYMAWLLGYLLTAASAYLGLSLFAEGSQGPGALRVLSRNAVLAALAVATAGALFLLLLSDKALLIFGPDYATEGATLLRIVALAALPAAVVNVYLGALRVMKRTGELIIVAGIVAVTTVTLSCALLPVMGLAGAGVGHGLGQSLGLVIILGRLLATSQGTTTERVRWLLTSLAGPSQVEVHQYAPGSGDAKAT